MNIQNITYVITVSTILLASCGKPSGMPEEDYAKYTELGAPKILYSCTSSIPPIAIVVQECQSKAKNQMEHADCLLDSWKRNEHSDNKSETFGYVAGVGLGATYNHILEDAQKHCSGTLKILDSKQ